MVSRAASERDLAAFRAAFGCLAGFAGLRFPAGFSAADLRPRVTGCRPFVVRRLLVAADFFCFSVIAA
jgi:hypothetical protein